MFEEIQCASVYVPHDKTIKEGDYPPGYTAVQCSSGDKTGTQNYKIIDS